MDVRFLSRRLNDLADNIDRDWSLLKEYEDLLRLTKDPKEKTPRKKVSSLAITKVCCTAICSSPRNVSAIA
jgi:hypothetical protein